METGSVHYNTERQERHAFIQNVIGQGSVIDSFIINRGHVGGDEVHSVTDTAVIIISNKLTNKIITELIARPEQLRRLYESDGRKPPKKVLQKAYRNNANRYNEI